MATAKPDWDKIKAEYISTNIPLRDLADKHGINRATVLKRAERGHWADLKTKVSARVVEMSTNEIVKSRVSELSKFNDDDVKIASALKQRAIKMLTNQEDLEPKDLQTIANVFSTAQRIGRTALNADFFVPEVEEEISEVQQAPDYVLPTDEDTPTNPIL